MYLQGVEGTSGAPCLSTAVVPHTVSAVKTETSKKIRQKKQLVFFPDFFYMRCPCPFLQVDSVSLCSDSVLSSKSGISKK
jgi:hypothetical protein